MCPEEEEERKKGHLIKEIWRNGGQSLDRGNKKMMLNNFNDAYSSSCFLHSFSIAYTQMRISRNVIHAYEKHTIYKSSPTHLHTYASTRCARLTRYLTTLFSLFYIQFILYSKKSLFFLFTPHHRRRRRRRHCTFPFNPLTGDVIATQRVLAL